jgi:hypothetical protein
MAPWDKKPAPAIEQEDGKDLKALLSQDERSEMIVFLSKIMERMQHHIEDIFDPSFTTHTKPTPLLQLNEKNPNVDNNEDDTKKNERELQDTKKREQELQDARLREVSAPKMKDMKKDALNHFHEWQTTIIMRVGEVINSREQAEHVQEQVHDSKITDKTSDEKSSAAGE